jgi:hypothetical protein
VSEKTGVIREIGLRKRAIGQGWPMSTSTRHIAIFGDTHGHLWAHVPALQAGQLAHGVRLDGILQDGDLGTGFAKMPSTIRLAYMRSRQV